MVLFIIQYKVVITFVSVDEIPKCDFGDSICDERIYSMTWTSPTQTTTMTKRNISEYKSVKFILLCDYTKMMIFNLHNSFFRIIHSFYILIERTNFLEKQFKNFSVSSYFYLRYDNDV